MKIMVDLLTGVLPSGRLTGDQRQAAAKALAGGAGARIYPASIVVEAGKLIALGHRDGQRMLCIAGREGGLAPFNGLDLETATVEWDGQRMVVGWNELTGDAACLVRALLPWTAPRTLGLACSAGLGDRIGLATPGHVRAVRGSGVAPIFAQQSIREMTRTERTPAEVIDAATWGVLQAGWRDGFGSDADHLKTPADIDACDAVGFTQFTIDPGEHVRNEADTLTGTALHAAFEAVDFAALRTSAGDLRRAYADRTVTLGDGSTLTCDAEALARAAVKYGGAIAHTARMFEHLVTRRGDRPFELEVSVDETASPTTVFEHYYFAAELKRLKVRWVGLAPRFIGAFEKGVDYIGSLPDFERDFAGHAEIARTLGPYKLSIHSGSDKFSLYPIIARHAGPLVHLKTAGTSYLEALRVAARCAPELFRQILDFAHGRFAQDRASYHISAEQHRVPAAADLPDGQLETVLDSHDGRQLLHVTFGSVLTHRDRHGRHDFRDALRDLLTRHEDVHEQILADHLGRHLRPFARQA